jgi:hypothetical protein
MKAWHNPYQNGSGSCAFGFSRGCVYQYRNIATGEKQNASIATDAVVEIVFSKEWTRRESNP